MAENTIKSRLQLKNDTEANWKKAVNFTPKKGEVIVYNIDDEHDTQRIKIGDGERNVNDLPFLEKELAAVATSGDYNDLINPPEVGGLVTMQLTIPTEGWNEDTLPVIIQLTDSKLHQFNEPIVDIVPTGDKDQDEAIRKAWFDIIEMETVDGGVKVYANRVPEVEIPVRLKEILSKESGGGSSGESGNSLEKVVFDHIPDAVEMDDNKIYFVKVAEVEGKDYYDQYVLIDGKCCSMAARVG